MGAALASSLTEKQYNIYNDVAGQVRTIRIGHTWSVGNFRAYCKHKKMGEAVVSPVFHSGPCNECKWRLILFPQGDREANKEYVSIFLQLLSIGDDSRTAIKSRFSVSLINSLGEEINKLKPNMKHTFLEGRSLWGYGRFIKRRIILDESNNLIRGPQRNGWITIFCENMGAETNVDAPAECNALHSTVCENLLKTSTDYEALLHNNKYSDVTIITSDNYELFAHKAILSIRSPVFGAMFEHNMREKQENIMVIDDVRKEIMEELLRFVYSGRVKNLENIVFELLVAADKYALEDLKNLCEDQLITGLNIKNAFDLLAFADIVNATKLKTKVNTFIIENSKEVINTIGFKSVMDSQPLLVAELFEKIADSK